VLEALPSYPLDDPPAALHALAVTLQRTLGGTSGPLYAAFFLRAAARLRGSWPDDPRAWGEAFQAGCTAVAELGGAGRGDRTMLDALLPAADAFQAAVGSGQAPADALRAAAAAATAGARAAADMVPRRGRSSYLGGRALGHPDPGAEAVVVWLGALLPS
jgi:dihydroxyacetone kinase